ncbi:hypothetical protein KPL35_01465 [Clostridium sp. CF011]|uniref:hypothetical protein n=1 Tax=unclassified Clostridium TaxID=2614128 RepID=UPI001C0DBAAB|nr:MULTISPECIES: hypothetical protein [unclassified Clostridium]MBU3090759.1 hypothetical protein [Clostridium sp. CF011]MBW9144676.1 hypothetical protein [Clostridium sp. CM027]UVE40572.1 hypothetical protein KTC92_15860 [Clostridium sp. CM027]WAG69535.1 hypothetical protein LL036_16320 [Clostridium sp. CF011]
MKRGNYNKYLIIASFFGFIICFIGHFIHLPCIIVGFCFGACIAFSTIGLYALNHDISKLKNFKRNLIRRIANN